VFNAAIRTGEADLVELVESMALLGVTFNVPMKKQHRGARLNIEKGRLQSKKDSSTRLDKRRAYLSESPPSFNRRTTLSRTYTFDGITDNKV
jgi:hypothetical protein